uniref:Uncharacterized protein n=1 Tax=Plectus sambesii TaxID=2011161 RepID=A0A914V4B4_9BILA
MRSFFLALVVIGAVGATQYRGERPPEL